MIGDHLDLGAPWTGVKSNKGGETPQIKGLETRIRVQEV